LSTPMKPRSASHVAPGAPARRLLRLEPHVAGGTGGEDLQPAVQPVPDGGVLAGLSAGVDPVAPLAGGGVALAPQQAVGRPADGEGSADEHHRAAVLSRGHDRRPRRGGRLRSRRGRRLRLCRGCDGGRKQSGRSKGGDKRQVQGPPARAGRLSVGAGRETEKSVHEQTFGDDGTRGLCSAGRRAGGRYGRGGERTLGVWLVS